MLSSLSPVEQFVKAREESALQRLVIDCLSQLREILQQVRPLTHKQMVLLRDYREEEVKKSSQITASASRVVSSFLKTTTTSKHDNVQHSNEADKADEEKKEGEDVEENAFRRKKRKSHNQLAVLKLYYSSCSKYPSSEEVSSLVEATGLSYSEVRQWFRTERKKDGTTKHGQLPNRKELLRRARVDKASSSKEGEEQKDERENKANEDEEDVEEGLGEGKEKEESKKEEIETKKEQLNEDENADNEVEEEGEEENEERDNNEKEEPNIEQEADGEGGGAVAEGVEEKEEQKKRKKEKDSDETKQTKKVAISNSELKATKRTRKSTDPSEVNLLENIEHQGSEEAASEQKHQQVATRKRRTSSPAPIATRHASLGSKGGEKEKIDANESANSDKKFTVELMSPARLPDRLFTNSSTSSVPFRSADRLLSLSSVPRLPDRIHSTANSSSGNALITDHQPLMAPPLTPHDGAVNLPSSFVSPALAHAADPVDEWAEEQEGQADDGIEEEPFPELDVELEGGLDHNLELDEENYGELEKIGGDTELAKETAHDLLSLRFKPTTAKDAQEMKFLRWRTEILDRYKEYDAGSWERLEIWREMFRTSTQTEKENMREIVSLQTYGPPSGDPRVLPQHHHARSRAAWLSLKKIFHSDFSLSQVVSSSKTDHVDESLSGKPEKLAEIIYSKLDKDMVRGLVEMFRDQREYLVAVAKQLDLFFVNVKAKGKPNKSES